MEEEFEEFEEVEVLTPEVYEKLNKIGKRAIDFFNTEELLELGMGHIDIAALAQIKTMKNWIFHYDMSRVRWHIVEEKGLPYIVPFRTKEEEVIDQLISDYQDEAEEVEGVLFDPKAVEIAVSKCSLPEDKAREALAQYFTT